MAEDTLADTRGGERGELFEVKNKIK